MSRQVNELVRRYRRAVAAGDLALAERLRARIARETEWRWWDRCDVDPGEAILEWIDVWGIELYRMMPLDD